MASNPWVRVHAAQEGDATEDSYYFMNTETRATTWDRPEGVEGEIPIYGRKFEGEVEEVPDEEGGDDGATAAKSNDEESETVSGNADDWWKVPTADGDAYYMNKETRATTWDKPFKTGEAKVYGKKFEGAIEEADESDNDAAEGNGGEATTKGTSSSPPPLPAAHEAFKVTAADEAEATVDTVIKVAGLNPPMHTRRILLIRLKKSDWELRNNATVGEEEADADDAYYYNVKTKESSWEKPPEFEQEQQLAYEGIAFDSDVDLMTNFGKIGIDSKTSIAERDLAKTTGDAEADKRVYGRLQSLLTLIREPKYGDNEDWLEVITLDDLALVRNIAQHLGAMTSADVRALAGRLLSGVCDMATSGGYDMELAAVIMDACNGPECLWAHIEQGFREAYAVRDTQSSDCGDGQDEDAEREWAELLQKFCVHLQANDIKGQSPSAGLVDIMFTIIGSALSHDAFLQMSLAMCSLNSLFGDDVKKNLVVRACISNPKSEHWGEALVHELNERGSGDEGMLTNILKVITDLYADKSTSNFFYTNDLYVMVDIIVRELLNLPPPSAMRVPYLKALSHLLQTSPWFGPGKQYRRADIEDAISSGIIDAYDNDHSFNSDVYELAKQVMSECGELLAE